MTNVTGRRQAGVQGVRQETTTPRPAQTQTAQPQSTGWQARTGTPGRATGPGPAGGADPAVAARAFADQRTPESFRAWADASPAGAATWLRNVSRAAGNTQAAGQLDTILQNPREKGADIARLYGQVHAMRLGGDAPAATNATGYTAFDPNARGMDPPSLSGRLSMENGQPMLTTAAGRFTVVNQSNFDGSHTLGGVDVQAFNGRTVTVRGWPDANWRPGQTGTLSVEEFSPGTSPDFLSGRVAVQGDDVFIQVRADKKVKVTDPDLVAALKNYDALGVVLPGALGADGTYGAKPGDYYVLAGFNAAGTPTRNGDQVEFTMQLAHGKTIQCQMPAESWDNTQRQQRHYFLGHFAEGRFQAQGLSPSAGPFVTQGTASRPSIEFIERAIPVVPEVVSANDARFGL